VHQGIVERIELLRPVERDQADAATGFDEDVLVVRHEVLLWFRQRWYRPRRAARTSPRTVPRGCELRDARRSTHATLAGDGENGADDPGDSSSDASRAVSP